MKRKALLIGLLLYGAWRLWWLRPMEPLKLSVPAAEAHPGIFSAMYRSRFAQMQALIDANPPVIDAKGLWINQDGGTIYFTTGRLPINVRNLNVQRDNSGYYAIWIGEKEN